MTSETHRVLCVDDEPGLARLVATRLERDDDLDCETAVETRPEDALRRIERESFDCVVSDYDMPRLTGVELLSAAREVDPDLPFLLFSATGPADIATEMVRAGVSDYVSKRGGADGYTALLRRVKRVAAGEGGGFGTEGVDGPTAAAVTLDGICTVAPDGTFEFVGDEYGALYGYDPEELEGEPWQRLHPDSAVEHLETNVIPAVTGGERWTGTSTGVRADGSRFAESKMVSATADDRLLISVSPLDSVRQVADD
ncbi:MULTISPECIES: response regulator [Halorubrum]|uniref:HTR-like protein n=1 Tax=Halorubrum hochstenium ATCC 700873 TaxID=1227481 RepID=M0FH99_9EURY|nr:MULTISPECIES: response regulator [Halorubrum]ELZ59416.1 HTR-like protein [Halorubrum hochstenium ATCC 700873]